MDKPYSSSDRYPPGSGTTSSQATTEQAKQESQRFAEKVKAEGQSMLADQKRAAADEIGGVADALRKVSHEMHQQEHPPMITPYAEQAAEGLERFSSTLRERDFNALVRQAEDFARRQPGIFLGGAVVTGFMLARFLRSSALHGEQDYPHSSQASSGAITSPAQGAVDTPSPITPTPSPGVRPTTPPTPETITWPY